MPTKDGRKPSIPTVKSCSRPLSASLYTKRSMPPSDHRRCELSRARGSRSLSWRTERAYHRVRMRCGVAACCRSRDGAFDDVSFWARWVVNRDRFGIDWGGVADGGDVCMYWGTSICAAVTRHAGCLAYCQRERGRHVQDGYEWVNDGDGARVSHDIAQAKEVSWGVSLWSNTIPSKAFLFRARGHYVASTKVENARSL